MVNRLFMPSWPKNFSEALRNKCLISVAWRFFIKRWFSILAHMNTKPHLHSFTPPFCPNFNCTAHFSSNFEAYVKNGLERTQKHPGFNQRFKCLKCGKGFSRNTFDLDFRKKLPGISEEILECSLRGMSNNSIASKLKVAEATVRNRLTYLARQSLLFEKEAIEDLKINEEVAYDGFETFTYDQYSPCYVNTAVGAESMFTYSTTFSPMNRKGRMTEAQKVKLNELIRKHKRYPTNSIAASSEYVFTLLANKTEGCLTLFTDEHLSYVKALKSVGSPKIKHISISSKLPRTTSNPLFPVNHLHRNYRHFFSSQHRETISFQKHEAGLMDKIQLMKVQKNFMRPKFARSSRRYPRAGQDSPAMYLGIAKKVLCFQDVFRQRRFKSHYLLDKVEENFFERRYNFSRRKIRYF